MTTIARRMTEEEFMQMPADGRKFELVDGEVREVPTSILHDMIVIHLARLLGPVADDYGILVGSQAGYRMTGGNVRCPDLGFIRFERFPEGQIPDGFGDFAPDLCIEIISPTEEPADMLRKLHEYFNSGAQKVWHMYPEKKEIRVFASPAGVTVYGPEDEVSLDDLLPGFRCRVADLFAIKTKKS